MSSFRIGWLLGGRRDRRTRAVVLVTLAALAFGLALQSARACVAAVSTGEAVAQASAHADQDRAGAEHCHHGAHALFDACFVHCEQDGQTARASSDAGADDLRLAAVYSPAAYGGRQAARAGRAPAFQTPPPDLPIYFLLHRLNR